MLNDLLSLDATQNAFMKALIADRDNRNERVHAMIEAQKKKLYEAWTEDEPQEDKILELHKELRELRGKISENRIRFKLALMTQLDSRQRRAFAALDSGRKSRRASTNKR